jgi:CheY-like chemotaxis protein
MYRILIVEDDISMAKTMARQIESWGNQVKFAKNF